VGEAQRLIYTPRPEATPECEVAVLGSVYAFLLNRYAKKKGHPVTNRSDDLAENEKGGRYVEHSISSPPEVID
jgi:hypothetical protein